MKILLTGGTGFIGSAVLDQLVAAGHRVTAVVRSQKSSLRVQDAGATGIIGDLFDPEWLAAELRGHDAAIHTAAGSDERDVALNDAVIDAVIAAFGGTTKPFIHTGGIWAYGNNAGHHRGEPARLPCPHGVARSRRAAPARLRRQGLGRAARHRVRLRQGHPGDARRRGRGRHRALFGTGEQRWTTVHVDDLADLYVRVLEQAPGGRAYIGVSGHNPTVRELGEALGGTVAPEGPEATVERLGGFGEALLLDQQASGQRAKSELGWQPSRPSLVDELRTGYAEAA